MPNVITPNGDGANDTFVIPCTQKQTWAIEIYNRWGKIVFYSKAYQGEWSGENQDNGIYFYTLTNPISKTTLKGMVHVLK
jgi:gliding motility-associated-like protein